MKKIKIIISWIIVFAIMALIFSFSSQVAYDSDQLSGGFISWIFTLYFRITGIPCSSTEFDSLVESMQFFVRKSAHFCIYATLGLTFANAYFQTGVKNLSRIASLALVSSAVYAITDEIHQLFVSGRSGEVRDVLIDSSGALSGILVFLLFMFLRRKIWILRKH